MRAHVARPRLSEYTPAPSRGGGGLLAFGAKLRAAQDGAGAGLLALGARLLAAQEPPVPPSQRHLAMLRVVEAEGAEEPRW